MTLTRMTLFFEETVVALQCFYGDFASERHAWARHRIPLRSRATLWLSLSLKLHTFCAHVPYSSDKQIFFQTFQTLHLLFIRHVSPLRFSGAAFPQSLY